MLTRKSIKNPEIPGIPGGGALGRGTEGAGGRDGGRRGARGPGLGRRSPQHRCSAADELPPACATRRCLEVLEFPQCHRFSGFGPKIFAGHLL